MRSIAGGSVGLVSIVGRQQTHVYLPRCLLDVARLLASELDGVFLIVVVDDGVDVRSMLKVYRMPTRSPLRTAIVCVGHNFTVLYLPWSVKRVVVLWYKRLVH